MFHLLRWTLNTAFRSRTLGISTSFIRHRCHLQKTPGSHSTSNANLYRAFPSTKIKSLFPNSCFFIRPQHTLCHSPTFRTLTHNLYQSLPLPSLTQHSITSILPRISSMASVTIQQLVKVKPLEEKTISMYFEQVATTPTKLQPLVTQPLIVPKMQASFFSTSLSVAYGTKQYTLPMRDFLPTPSIFLIHPTMRGRNQRYPYI